MVTMLAAGTPTQALQLICRLPSARDGSLLETLKVAVDAQGAVGVLRKWERTSYRDEGEKNERVLFHSLTTGGGDEGKAQFSVLVIEQRSVADKYRKVDLLHPPEVSFIDWEKGNLVQVNVPFTLEPLAQVDSRWKCERTD
jgi:hypothetical protein